MSVTLLQGLILALIVFAFAWDARWECFFVFHPIIVCFVTGLVLGDWKLGLEAGAIAELSYLGLTTVGGTVPPNPTELLARDGLDKAIETLKKNFDYVILDTAPAGMVTDTLLIGRVADLSVYVCRADYSRKAEFTLINELAADNKLPNICTIINGLDLKKKKYGYYYGYGKYGKYYGYGKRYGYGYGYGERKVKEG